MALVGRSRGHVRVVGAPSDARGKAAVGLALVRTERPGVNQTTAAYIGVTDVDGLHDHCQRHGATVVMPLRLGIRPVCTAARPGVQLG